MGTEPPTPPAVDPSAAGPPPKILHDPATGMWGYRCQICPDARAGKLDDDEAAAMAYEAHTRKPGHRKHLAARLEDQHG
jgi:hypothetical protein